MNGLNNYKRQYKSIKRKKVYLFTYLIHVIQFFNKLIQLPLKRNFIYLALVQKPAIGRLLLVVLEGQDLYFESNEEDKSYRSK